MLMRQMIVFMGGFIRLRRSSCTIAAAETNNTSSEVLLGPLLWVATLGRCNMALNVRDPSKATTIVMVYLAVASSSACLTIEKR